MKKPLLSGIFDFLEILFIGIATFGLVYLFIGQLFEVTGDSMDPTFIDKEQIVAEKLSIKLEPIKRGEIVIFKHPNDPQRPLIKRVIGLPEETILISGGFAYIDGNKLDEPYLPKNITTAGKDFIKDDIPFKIPANSYVVLGDNRNNSSDSREWGTVSADYIIARPILVYYPLSNFRWVKS